MTYISDDDSLDAYGEIGEEELTIKPGDFQDMVVAPTDWTISVLIDLLRRGIIDLQPNYQRRIAWTNDKMSKFIESLFLRLPVPQIVLAETSPGRFAVIDGKQRLNSIARFCLDTDKPLRLKDCDYRMDLNGMTWQDMLDDRNLTESVEAFQSHTVRSIVIKNWRSNSLIYLLFLRLNQNSVTLSPQELRRALYPGAFMNWLDETTGSSRSMELIFKKIPDFRMRDMEVGTRFLAFDMFGSSYRGNMKVFLDDVSEYLSKNWSQVRSQVEDEWGKYEEAVHTTFDIFGNDAFKVWQKDRYQNTRNRAVMDIMTYYFAEADTAARARQKPGPVQNAFKELCDTEPGFLQALQSSTKTERATDARFEFWRQALRDTLGSDVRAYPSKIFEV